MTRSSDPVKAATWKQHYDRFQLSGLSVSFASSGWTPSRSTLLNILVQV